MALNKILNQGILNINLNEKKHLLSFWIKKKILNELMNNITEDEKVVKLAKYMFWKNKINPQNKKTDSDFKDEMLIIYDVLWILWLKLDESLQKSSIYIFKEFYNIYGACLNEYRIIGINDKWSEKESKHTFYHEYWHHIWELIYSKNKDQRNSWYKWDYINECFAECFAYMCIYKELWVKTNIMEFPNSCIYQIIDTLKLIILASKKLNIDILDIYNYMLRWYFMKWYKWLNLFYHAFWGDFLQWFMCLWTNEKDEINFIKLSKRYYKNLWFQNKDEVEYYFAHQNIPQLILDHIWIDIYQ